jgi:hypothetical protein
MKDFIDILDPTAKPTVKEERLAAGVNDLNGKVIGLVDNRKPNFDIFLEHLEKALTLKYKFKEIVHLKKGGTGATIPMTPDEMAKLVGKCDAVVYGVCD